MIQEPVFGLLVVLGLGGVATRVLSDHGVRLVPLTDAGDLTRSVCCPAAAAPRPPA